MLSVMWWALREHNLVSFAASGSTCLIELLVSCIGGSLSEIEGLVEQKIQARLSNAEASKDDQAIEALLPVLQLSSSLQPHVAKATTTLKQLRAMKAKDEFRVA